ncbi:hypothetical protein ACAK56_003421 [Salmonella enterica]
MVNINFGDKKIHQDAEYNADQAEFDALKFGTANIDSGIADDNIADSLDDYELEIPLDEDWAMRDTAKDSAAGLLLDKLKSRAELLGETYPFTISGSRISLKTGNTNLVYRFCLAISNAPNITTGEYVKLPRKFEHVAGMITKTILGNDSKWFHTGWPRSDNKPKKFIELAEEIKKEVCAQHEWTWMPQSGLEDCDAKAFKDCGIDYLAWTNMFDNREGKLFITGQCACGNDWTGKFKDINFPSLKGWFHPLTWITPTKALAIPYCASNGYLYQSSQDDNILLDRIRLSLLFEKNKVLLDVKELEDLIDMVKNAA